MLVDFRFRRSGPAILALGMISALSPETAAHFLFARIGPIAEGGRSAEVYFSEQAKAGDPRFIPKIAHTRLWVQSRPGEFRELTVQAGADRLRAALPAAKSLGVVGECRYGVLARPKQTPFLLRHYPKAVAGTPDEINRLVRRPEIPFEIAATIDRKNETSAAAQLRLVAMRQGKPMPGAVFHAVDADLAEVKFTAGPDGSASWTPPATGYYCIYVADTLKESGELDGKRYDEVRDFATLSLAWPLDRSQADPEAMALFRKAIAHRAQWRDFPGFSADISGELDGRAFDGKMTIAADGQADVEVDDEAARPWLKDQLESLARHRLPAPAQGQDPGFTLRFADDSDEHPLGRLLLVEGGRMASSYRIKGDQIRVVNRNLGRQSMTLSVLTNEENRERSVLPRQYLVHYWDAESGRLLRTETIQDQWIRTGRWDLPRSHAVATASDGGMSLRNVTLSGHTLLKKP
jgi:hypothetical protein